MKAIQLIAQERAAFALKKMSDAKSKSVDEQKQIRTVANTMPAQIQRTGLGQTLAFALSKEKKADGKGWVFFHQLLQEWLCQERKLYSGQTLMSSLCDGDMYQYQQAQTEAMALLIWVRKFARAMLENDKES
jgi:CRISPR-associated protein, Cmr5 family